MKKITFTAIASLIGAVALTTQVQADTQDSMHSNMHQNMSGMHQAMHGEAMHENDEPCHHQSAVGYSVKDKTPQQTVEVILSDDMKIHLPENLVLEQGKVVAFNITNTGKLEHEFSIGSKQEQLQHREMMKAMQGGDHHHDMPNVVTLKPGEKKTLQWVFEGDLDVQFACNIIGHAEAGMVTDISIQALTD